MPEALQDYTVEATGAAWSEFETEVNPPLGLTVDRFDSGSDQFLEADDTTAKAGILQGLMDLGYLPENDTGFSKEAVQSALDQWRKDTRQWPSLYSLTDGTGAQVAIANDTLTLEHPFPVLTIQTAFDGDLKLIEMPSLEGEPSLASRILQFRLRALNRFDEEVGSPLPAWIMETLKDLRAHFTLEGAAPDAPIDFLNHLGDAAYLAQQFSQRYKQQIFVTKYKPTSQPKPTKRASDYSVLQFKSLQSKKRSLRTRRRVKEANYLLSHALSSNVSESLTARFENDVNTLGLELLQLRLWQHGYYKGALDADWGKASDEALKDFHDTFREDEAEKSFRHYPRRDFIAPVVGGQVVNICFIFEQLFNDADQTIHTVDRDHLEATAEHVFPDASETATWRQLDHSARKLNRDLETTLKQNTVQTFRHGKPKANLRRQRKNFSRVGVIGSISGWFRRFGDKVKSEFQRIAGKIRRAIVSGARSVRTFFRFALSKIKRVIRVVKVALQRFYYWIAGKPFGSGDPRTGAFIMTRWSIDFDTINVIRSDTPNELLEYHMKRIAFMNASFHFVVKVALEVLGLLIDFAKLSGLGLAHSMYQSIRDLGEWSENNPFRLYLEPAYQH